MTNDRDPESAAAYLTELWKRTGMPPLSPEAARGFRGGFFTWLTARTRAAAAPWRSGPSGT
jgi:hypothetical protein